MSGEGEPLGADGAGLRASAAPVHAAAARSKPSGLGRGLSALLGDLSVETPVLGSGAPSRDGLAMIAIELIEPHPDQPRRTFDETALNELADSIAARGVVQPVLVRPLPGGRYQLVAGERRWRASQRASLTHLPAIVRELDDTDTFAIALIENIQRADLNAIEEAEAYDRLRGRLGHSQDSIARMTGKSRSHIANLLRLLELPESVRTMVANGDLGMGHARALIGLDDAEEIARAVVDKGLSARKVEALARASRQKRNGRGPVGHSGSMSSSARNPDLASLESHLTDLLGLNVQIDHDASGRGLLTVQYGTLDQLDMLCQRLSGEQI